MMDLVSEKYPTIEWIVDEKGKIKKENYDACDSLVCVLAYINKKRHGEISPKITDTIVEINETTNETNITYTVEYWDKTEEKILKIINN